MTGLKLSTGNIEDKNVSLIQITKIIFLHHSVLLTFRNFKNFSPNECQEKYSNLPGEIVARSGMFLN